MSEDKHDWMDVINLVKAGEVVQAKSIIEGLLRDNPDDCNVNYAAGRYLYNARNFSHAVEFFKKSYLSNNKGIDLVIYLSLSLSHLGTHRGSAECRDILTKLFNENPEFITKHPLADAVLRTAARCCSEVGPMTQAHHLWKMLSERSGNAEDYFNLSEISAILDHLDEAEAALKKAIELDPEKYAKPAHLHTLEIIESARREGSSHTVKKSRYPLTEAFRGDLAKLIKDQIAVEHKKSKKFIKKDTVFFTMGSCFARNISFALTRCGYKSHHLGITEAINTTFANKSFVDWLEGTLPDPEICERIQELMSAEDSREIVIDVIKQADVFILTLGVAPAFFDRKTGQFVMPRPTALNQRALAEKYIHRTTTVGENVDNVIYFLSYVRKLSPHSKIIVTVSPVPLHMTFEFDSAVTADCLSKSTMRLAAHEIVNNHGLKDIYYWPSFEIFRWAGSHAGPYFGTDDGAAWHVSEAAVETTVGCFIEMFKSEQE